MASTPKKHFKEVARIVEEFTKDHSISLSNGDHIKVILRRGQRFKTVFASQTPSDHRSMKNFRSKVRIAFNEMAA